MWGQGRYLRCVLKKQPQREKRVSLLLRRLFWISAKIERNWQTKIFLLSRPVSATTIHTTIYTKKGFIFSLVAVYLSIYLQSIYLSIYLPTYLSIYLDPIYLPIYLPTYLCIYLSTYLSLYLSIYPYLPIYIYAKDTRQGLVLCPLLIYFGIKK